MRGYLLDEMGGAVPFRQVDLLAESDVGGLGGDLPAVLALELRSSTQKQASNPQSERFAIDREGKRTRSSQGEKRRGIPTLR